MGAKPHSYLSTWPARAALRTGDREDWTLSAKNTNYLPLCRKSLLTSRVQNPEKAPHTADQCGKEEKLGVHTGKKMHLCITADRKINCRWSKDLNVKTKLYFLKKNKYLSDLREAFLN